MTEPQGQIIFAGGFQFTACFRAAYPLCGDPNGLFDNRYGLRRPRWIGRFDARLRSKIEDPRQCRLPSQYPLSPPSSRSSAKMRARVLVQYRFSVSCPMIRVPASVAG